MTVTRLLGGKPVRSNQRPLRRMAGFGVSGREWGSQIARPLGSAKIKKAEPRPGTKREKARRYLCFRASLLANSAGPKWILAPDLWRRPSIAGRFHPVWF